MSPFTALQGSMQDFRQLPGENLLDRLQPFYDWQQSRRAAGLWPLGRSTETGPHSVCQARTDEGQLFQGVNLASPIVCVKMGSEALAPLVSRQLPGAGVLCNLVEYPAVAKGAARFRLQVMAGHQAADIDKAVQRLSVAQQLAAAL